MIKIDALSENWEQVWQLSIPTTQEPLSRQFCSILLTTPVVACQLNLVGGFHTGRLGAYLNQHIESGLLGGSFGDARVGGGKKIFVDQLQIVIFDIFVDYKLSFDLLTRISSPGTFTVFEYTGLIT